MDFDRAFDILLGHEGGYSNHPSDPGGETMWGVTRKVALQNGYTGDMHVFPREKAKDIYRRKYWDAVQADQIPPSARYALFDAAVNSGPAQAIRWLQRAVDVVDDGVLGPITLRAAQATNGLKVCVLFSVYRLDFLTNLPTWGAFGKGWARRVSSNLESAAKDDQ